MTTCVTCCQPGNLTRLHVWGFHWGSSCGHSAWHVPKFQTPRRKADVQHKPHLLCKLFGHSEALLAVLGRTGTLPKSKFPNASQGPTSRARLERQHSGLLHMLLPARVTVRPTSAQMSAELHSQLYATAKIRQWELKE